jgi:hypothetical protein
MEYTVKIINVLRQDGFYYCTFILEDLTRVMPLVRLNKRFNDNENLFNEIEIAKIADCTYFKEQYMNSIEEL